MRRWGKPTSLCIALTALGALVGVAGCGEDDSPSASAQDSGASSPTKIEVPEGLPPKRLVLKDLRVGTGKEAENGDEVQIRYYGVIWKSGAEQANTWRTPEPPTFVLGDRTLLRGLNLAVPGMREGGSREVLIPPKLVYYPGRGPRPVRPLDALVYKVSLIKVLERNFRS